MQCHWEGEGDGKIMLSHFCVREALPLGPTYMVMGRSSCWGRTPRHKHPPNFPDDSSGNGPSKKRNKLGVHWGDASTVS